MLKATVIVLRLRSTILKFNMGKGGPNEQISILVIHSILIIASGLRLAVRPTNRNPTGTVMTAEQTTHVAHNHLMKVAPMARGTVLTVVKVTTIHKSVDLVTD